MASPFIGGKSFSTGLEDFPWGSAPQEVQRGSSGSIGSESGPISMGRSVGGSDEFESSDSGGGISDAERIAWMQAQLQTKKTNADFNRMVKQARFFLPRTLADIAGQYGTQGSYWSSGRRGEQQEAAKKTRFDLAQAKADAEFSNAQTWLQLQGQMNSG